MQEDRSTHYLVLECTDEELRQLIELCRTLGVHGKVLEEVDDEG